MEKCKFCPEMLEEGSTVCPGCGRDNAEEVKAEETAAPEETPAVEENAPAEAAAEDTAFEEVKSEAPRMEPGITKVSSGKMALVIAGIVAAIAIIVAMLMVGAKPEAPAEDPATEPVLETEVAVPTIPADGNPDDETCKGTYTVSDADVQANADTVVATMGEHKLTNAQLQTFYWMQVQSFLSSEYGNYMMYYGMLDYTQPLDTQICAMTGSGTWQQFFLAEALNTWQNYCVLADEAKNAGLELDAEEQALLDSMEENLQASAEYYGMESVEDLLKKNMGAGAGMEEYIHFQDLLIRGNKYYDAEVSKINPTMEELETLFAEHEEEYAQNGITKEAGDLVDVRHVLFIPEGGEMDETGATVYSEEAWADCEAKAKEAMNAWTKGEATEATFAEMAMALSQDPGSQSAGGLYTGVQQGQMVEAFDAWCFDEKRAPGHNGIVKTDYGYHLMYFVGKMPIWESYARQDYAAEKTNAMMLSLTEGHPMDVDYSAITLGLVNLGS